MARTLSPFAVWGLLRELKIAAEDTKPLVVSGPLAEQLAKELARGGSPGAVRTSGRPADAALLVRVLGGAPTEADEAELKAANRARVPVLAREPRARGAPPHTDRAAARVPNTRGGTAWRRR